MSLTFQGHKLPASLQGVYKGQAFSVSFFHTLHQELLSHHPIFHYKKEYKHDMGSTYSDIRCNPNNKHLFQLWLFSKEN